MEIVLYIDKRLVHLPLMIVIRALCNWNDLEIFNEFMQTMKDEKNYYSAIKRMLDELTNVHLKRKLLKQKYRFGNSVPRRVLVS